MPPKDPHTQRALANASRALTDNPAAAGLLAAAIEDAARAPLVDVPRSPNRTPADAVAALEHAAANIRGAAEPYPLELRAHAFRLVADIDHALATRAARRAAAELAP
jgi:hypothetical protein